MNFQPFFLLGIICNWSVVSLLSDVYIFLRKAAWYLLLKGMPHLQQKHVALVLWCLLILWVQADLLLHLGLFDQRQYIWTDLNRYFHLHGQCLPMRNGTKDQQQPKELLRKSACNFWRNFLIWAGIPVRSVCHPNCQHNLESSIFQRSLLHCWAKHSDQGLACTSAASRPK